MKKSIRTKLFIGISCLGLFFIVLSWVLNTQYLEKYYINHKKDMLLINGEIIDNIYDGEPININFELEKIERNIGGYIHIVDRQRQIKYNSFEGIPDRIITNRNTGDKTIRRRPMPIPPPVEGIELDRKYIFTLHENKLMKTVYLTLIYRLNNGDILDIMVPLTAISESAHIANNFFIITGIIVIIFGIIFAFIFSRKFTKPILVLNEIAQRMAKFDFSKKYDIETEDEVGELGRNINYLSEQLADTLSKLNEKNKKLKEDIERERKIDEMRKEFISSVSHELKTPIALIQGYAEGLTVNVNEDEESKNFYCEVIVDEAKKMDKLVKDLLNLFQMESGYFKLERSKFDISILIDRVLEKYRPIFEENGIILSVEKEKNIFVDGDCVRIEQVLNNYINNGVNHIEFEKNIKVKVTVMDQKVRVSVFNSGKWIPQEAIGHIWTSFYKVDKARTRDYGGTGLGLSIVRSILELHDNHFGVKNVDGGVVFWFDMDKM